jgi:hypothetical protein
LNSLPFAIMLKFRTALIQFSRPRRPMDGTRVNRFEHSARELMAPAVPERECSHSEVYLSDSPTARSPVKGVPTRFEPGFFRNETGYIPSDVQSIRSQATYVSGLPSNFTSSGLSSYGGSMRSVKTASVAGSFADETASIAFSQADRLNADDTESEYKSQAGTLDDDRLSQLSSTTPSQVTVSFPFPFSLKGAQAPTDLVNKITYLLLSARCKAVFSSRSGTLIAACISSRVRWKLGLSSVISAAEP